MSDDGRGKTPAAMLAIGELAARVGVPTHVLRYWETRFPQLKPLQRSGRRRYYRAEDVALVERIHHLLHVQGFTVEGARKALSDTADLIDGTSVPASQAAASDPTMISGGGAGVPVAALIALRQRLAAALR
ncbi:MAG: MerR family transcriptional regulator [Sphingopyxis sp.]|nr:MerR family transcriptional regulator [Sphingopyxis sp.]